MKNAIHTILAMSLLIFVFSCGESEGETVQDKWKTGTSAPAKANPKGIGEIRSVELTDPMDEEMIASGKSIYEMKCSACHKLTDLRVVGPGWAGITNRRRPEWVMNMITNVEVMLDEDPEAQKLLEECLTRMPNQGVSMEEARALLEFMRSNDVEQVGSKDGATS